MTEAQGVPVGLAVDGANRHDMKLVRATVDSLPVSRPAPSPEQPQGLCLDKGYDFDQVRDTVAEFGFTAHIRSRGEEAQAIKREAGFKARRWVVERTHGWLNRFRRVLVRWDKSPENYIAFLHFACALIALRAAGLLGWALSRLQLSRLHHRPGRGDHRTGGRPPPPRRDRECYPRPQVRRGPQPSPLGPFRRQRSLAGSPGDGPQSGPLDSPHRLG